jgi:hypothetical protein
VVSLFVAPGCVHARNNGIDSIEESKKIFSSVRLDQTLIQVPIDYPFQNPQKITFEAEKRKVHLYSRLFAQGEAVYIEIISSEKGEPGSHIRCSFNGRAVPLTHRGWGYRGLFAISPDEKTPGGTLTLESQSGKIVSRENFRIKIEKTDFPVSHTALNLGKYSSTQKLTPETVAFIQRCMAKKKSAFSRFSEDSLTPSLSHPRDIHRITSPFYSKRIIEKFALRNGKRIPLKPSINIHSGLDLQGLPGDPIFAMARGRIAISEKMHYEGNFTLIDHGNGVFTGYMHQSDLFVKEGETVEPGQKIGTSGATGAVTGAHLHVALYIGSVPVNPLGLLSLPIRN